MVSDEIRGRPGCPMCGGRLTVYGTVNMGPDPSDGERCWDCIDWIEAGCPDEGPQSTHEAIADLASVDLDATRREDR